MHRRRHTCINAHGWTQLSGSTRGSGSGSPITEECVYLRMCVCVFCMCVCWVGSQQFLLILVHRITARLSRPITARRCWHTQPASVRVCALATVRRSPPAVSCWRDGPQVSACDFARLGTLISPSHPPMFPPCQRSSELQELVISHSTSLTICVCFFFNDLFFYIQKYFRWAHASLISTFYLYRFFSLMIL